jgi:hypothetical protein
MVIITIKYRCPYCYRRHNNENDVESCIAKCLLEDKEPYIEIYSYYCKFCEKDYDNENDAIKCEEKHEKLQDYFYDIFMSKKSQLKLKEASEHKYQIKLKPLINKKKE